MMFRAVIPTSGYAGWLFLNRTASRQQAILNATPQMQRNTDYFRGNIGKVTTADALVADRRLLAVALTAFGLEGDVANTAFIRKILADGTLNTKALGSRLADKRYLALSKAFGFGDYDTPRTQLSDFADTIIAAYRSRRFETAVGETDNSLRLALNARRELKALALAKSSPDVAWLTVLGSAPLRSVFQTAFGLPAASAGLDLDAQIISMRGRAQQMLGNGEVSQFADGAQIEKLVRLFVLRSQTEASANTSSAAIALNLLR